LTCSGARNLSLLLTLVLLAGCAGAPTRSATDLTNPFLGPEYTGWLIGPIARLATPEEIEAFQAITTDEQAQAFVEAFWAKRTGVADAFGNRVRGPPRPTTPSPNPATAAGAPTAGRSSSSMDRPRRPTTRCRPRRARAR
jgi:hypothetical protein